jgi:hypothetical protein
VAVKRGTTEWILNIPLTVVLTWKEPKATTALNKVTGAGKREQSLAGTFVLSHMSTRCDFVTECLKVQGLEQLYAPNRARGPPVKISFWGS